MSGKIMMGRGSGALMASVLRGDERSFPFLFRHNVPTDPAHEFKEVGDECGSLVTSQLSNESGMEEHGVNACAIPERPTKPLP